jgi:hypothetical protein
MGVQECSPYALEVGSKSGPFMNSKASTDGTQRQQVCHYGCHTHPRAPGSAP